MKLFDVFEKLENDEFTETNSDDGLCDICGSNEFIENNGSILCSSCLTTKKKIQYKSSITESETSTTNTLFINGKLSIGVYGKACQLQNQFKYISVPYEEKSIRKTYEEIVKLVKAYIELHKLNYQTSQIEDLVADSITLYKEVVLCDKKRRNRKKKGLIAVCFYYRAKEQYMNWSEKELAEIFDIDIKYITSSFNIVNIACSENPKLLKKINDSPIRPIDILDKIELKFPELTNDDIDLLRLYINRISNLPLCLYNTPGPVVSGVLYAYCKLKNKPINIKTISTRLSVSDSSVRQYYEKFSKNIYEIKPIYSN